MNKVSESIWASEDIVIPMAEVSYIEKKSVGQPHEGISIVMKHSKWSNDLGYFEPTIWLSKKDADKFLQDWCFYRHEIEGGKEAFKGSEN